jgi:GDPmannose 4,6-dehydratase
MSKKALITGIRGQDGAYLSKLLLEKGYEVYGADRRSGDSESWRLKYVGADKGVKLVYMDLLEQTNVIDVIKRLQPDEIYNLAAQSFVKVSFEQPHITSKVDALGVLNLLEAVKHFSPHSRFYQASTSELYGKVQAVPQDENTPFYPRSPYAVAKLYAHWMTINYRESYDLYACSGILFNHESPLRGIEFVTRKITNAVAKIQLGLQDNIVLGNMDAQRDWGYAAEYVEGMWRMLQQDTPDDYVIATGRTHSVKKFVELSFKAIDTEIVWEGEGVDTKGIDRKTNKVLVETSPEFYRPSEVELLIGNPTKAKEKLGWEAKTSLEDLLDMMVKADMKMVEEEQKK